MDIEINIDEFKNKILDVIGRSTLKEEVVHLIINRFQDLGYNLKSEDSWLISFSFQKVENNIKNKCNISSIPNGLKYIAVDNVVGEFLFTAKQTGKLNDSFNLDTAVKQIQLGDTNVTFDIEASNEDNLNKLINYLLSRGEDDFICYRKMRW